MSIVDFVEFVERAYGIRLLEYQKTFLRELVKLCENGTINLVGRYGRVFIYPNHTILKELIHDGKTSDCKQ